MNRKRITVFKYLIVYRCIPFLSFTQPAEGCGSVGRDNKAIRKPERKNPLDLHHHICPPLSCLHTMVHQSAESKLFYSAHLIRLVQISILPSCQDQYLVPSY